MLSLLALPCRENEGEVNVFDKPDEQRPSLLVHCHGEKTKAKSTFSVSQMTKESLLALAWREKVGCKSNGETSYPKTKTMEGGCMFFL